MRKYWTIYKTTILESVNRRGEMTVYILQDFIGPLLSILLWIGIIGNAGSIQAGWDTNRTVSYFLVTTLLTLAVNHYVDTEVGRKHISQGELANLLAKPMSFYRYVFFTETGWKTIRLFLALIPFGFFLWFFRDYIHLSISISQIVLALGFSILSYFIIFFYKFLIGLTAFWVTDNGGFVHASWAIQAVFAGRLIPFDFLPHWLQGVSWWLPYRFFFYVPANSLLTSTQFALAIREMIVGIFWLIFLIILNRWVFNKGVKLFTDTRS